jgi:Fur family zinc uptake transcriptional regulator
MAGVLDRAERVCARAQVRLTPQRRRVLQIIAASHEAIGAYDILEQMALKPRTDGKRRPAPVTVYRALDFLMAHGLVHRIATSNSYVACGREHREDAVLLLICSKCGQVGEIAAEPLVKAVAAGAAHHGFAVTGETHEVTGECRQCRLAA